MLRPWLSLLYRGTQCVGLTAKIWNREEMLISCSVNQNNIRKNPEHKNVKIWSAQKIQCYNTPTNITIQQLMLNVQEVCPPFCRWKHEDQGGGCWKGEGPGSSLAWCTGGAGSRSVAIWGQGGGSHTMTYPDSPRWVCLGHPRKKEALKKAKDNVYTINPKCMQLYYWEGKQRF